jgi:hypothetical protein
MVADVTGRGDGHCSGGANPAGPEGIRRIPSEGEHALSLLP